MTGTEIEIGLATAAEAEACSDLERRAATLFSPEDLSPALAAQATAVAVYAQAQREERLIASRHVGGRLVGFAHVTIPSEGEAAHLEELDVDPDWGRQGVGSRLVAAVFEWAEARGFREVHLSTFRDVPWNAPFYARLGFEIVDESEWTAEMRALREAEREQGLDPDRRVLMRREVAATEGR